MKQNWFNKLAPLSAVIFTAATLSACGPQPFVPGSVRANALAGSMAIPPRVDIVLGTSMSGTMKNIVPGIATEVPAFTKGLEGSGWDYRFVSIPLHDTRPASSFALGHNVSGSQYHTNWVAFGSWKSPFPGATNTDPNLTMLSSLFNTGFVLPNLGDPAIPNDGREGGLQILSDFVNRSDVNTGASDTGVLRPDAILAVIVLSNDDDKSGGQWRCRWNPQTASYPATCPDYNKEWVAPSPDNLQNFRTAFLNAKGGNPGLVKYYSLSAPATVYCRGYAARYGERYGVKMTQIMGGKTIDICANGLQASLQKVSEDLQQQKLNFRTKYIVLGTRPNVGTIKVTKHTSSGDVDLVQGDPNGWSWTETAALPQPRTVYTIDSPIPMTQATGYVIELHGTGRLIGDETATVDYMNEGQVVAQ